MVWLSVAAISRYSSLAALVASVAVPAFAFYGGSTTVAVALCAMTIIVYLTHRANIQRLLSGRESRIGSKGGP